MTDEELLAKFTDISKNIWAFQGRVNANEMLFDQFFEMAARGTPNPKNWVVQFVSETRKRLDNLEAPDPAMPHQAKHLETLLHAMDEHLTRLLFMAEHLPGDVTK